MPVRAGRARLLLKTTNALIAAKLSRASPNLVRHEAEIVPETGPISAS